MASVACPHCGLPIADSPELAGQSVSCPQCRGVFQMPLAIQSATRTIHRHKPTHHLQNTAWLITAMIPAALLILCGITCSGSFEQSAATTRQADVHDLKSEARYLAREAVKQFVTFPRDAEFSWLSEAEKTPHGHWIVSGEVKTINAFGAKITHDYRVTLFHSPRDGQWSVGEVEIDGTVAYSDEKTLSRRTITRHVKGN